MINYNNRRFQAISNSENGEVPANMIFTYRQEGAVLFCNYQGGSIVRGHLLGNVDEDGVIYFSYHQINIKGELLTGKCTSTPKVENGIIHLYEEWEWTCKDFSKGKSILKETTNVDKRDKLLSDPFTYKFTKDNKLLIYRSNKQIKIVSGKESLAFLKLSESADEKEVQLRLAKLTGHYKH